MKILSGCDRFLAWRIACGAWASAGLLVLTGCNRDEIRVYRVAKETAQPAAPSAPDAPTAAARPAVTWKTPAGWEEVAPGEMRLASFKAKGKAGGQADISIVPLPGMAGGDGPNVNRWRGQVGLPPVAEAELETAAVATEVGGQPAKLYELVGTNPSSGDATGVIGVIQHREETAWFFKMTGDAAAVAESKPAFLELLKSLNFAAAAAPAGIPAGGETIFVDGKPTWTVPAGWTEVPGGQFLVAKFTVAGADGAQAAVNVSNSAGDGGGLAGNVNRWRKQLGLAEFSSAELAAAVKPLAVAGGSGSVVELSGTDARSGKPAALVGAVVPQGDRTWFYKLMGDAQVVAAQQEAFTKFVQGVKY